MIKKIYQVWFYLVMAIIVIILVPVCVVFSIKFFSDDGGSWDLVFAGLSGPFAILAFRLMVPRKVYITINFDKKSVCHTGYPVVLAYSHRKERKKIEEAVNLKEFSNEMFLSDTISVEVYKLNKIEKKNVRGFYVFSKFLKFNSADGKQNYIPIAMYSKRQIKKLIEYIQEINPKIEQIKPI